MAVVQRKSSGDSGNKQLMMLILALNTVAMLMFGAYMIYATNRAGAGGVKTEL